MAGLKDFFLRFRGAGAGGKVAVEFRDDGIALAAVNMVGVAARLTFCDFLPDLKSGREQTDLERIVEEAGLKGSPASLVLAPGQYRLDILEAPDVPPGELRDAVRHQIASSLDYPIEEAAVDAFLMPEDGLRGGRALAFVVSARRDDIRPYLDRMEHAGLQPKHIDIREMALRNLVERFADTPSAGALLSLRHRGGDLMIVRDGAFYMNRAVNFEMAAMSQSHAVRDAALEDLVVEIQRSLHYFEIQMRQAPVSRLGLIPLPEYGDVLLEKLTRAIGAEVFLLEADMLAQSEKELSQVKRQRCVGAIGGVLRFGEVPLATAG